MIASDAKTLNQYVSQPRLPETQGNGFCILLDIIDSTTMKSKHTDWKRRFIYFYEAFNSLIDGMAAKLELEHPAVRKFLGDAAFAYLPVSVSDNRPKVIPTSHATNLILSHVQRFERYFRLNREILGIRFRVVLSYVTHIHLVEFPSGSGPVLDALGQGIDFTFRLEKMSSEESPCVNAMFRAGMGTSELLRKWDISRHMATVKGWAAPQPYYLLRWPDIAVAANPELRSLA
jgi:hypothetical protein